MHIRVLLADDHKIMREGLRSLLANEEEIEVVSEAENGRQTLELVRQVKPDVVVMDIAMPDLNGIEATQRIVSHESAPKVIALSMHSDKRFVTQMLRAGASGYLLKDCALEELAFAIRTVATRGVYLSPAIAGVVTEEIVHPMTSTDSGVCSPLTSREREVLQLLAEGHGTKEIAAMIDVSVKTVETHRQNVMAKLDLHSIAELTKYAVREGLTSLED
jgi:DNA-binding NarL/FixJ family response regulator